MVVLDGLLGCWNECLLSLHHQKSLKEVAAHPKDLYSYWMMSTLLPRDRRQKKTVDSAIRAGTTDELLATLLNIAVCQNGDDLEKYLVIVITK